MDAAGCGCRNACRWPCGRADAAGRGASARLYRRSGANHGDLRRLGAALRAHRRRRNGTARLRGGADHGGAGPDAARRADRHRQRQGRSAAHAPRAAGGLVQQGPGRQRPGRRRAALRAGLAALPAQRLLRRHRGERRPAEDPAQPGPSRCRSPSRTPASATRPCRSRCAACRPRSTRWPRSRVSSASAPRAATWIGSRRASASVTATMINPSATASSQETGAAVMSALLPKPMQGTTSVVRLATAAGKARMMRNQQA